MNRYLIFLVACLWQMPVQGSALSELAKSMEPGSFAELLVSGPVSNCNVFIPPSGSGSIFEYTDEAQWNPKSREVYVMGTARPYRLDDFRFAIYSEATNSWTIQPNPQFNPGFHGYDHAAMDTSNGDFYWAMTGIPYDVRRLDYSTKTWQDIPDVPTNHTPQAVAIEYFPEMGGIVFINSFSGGEYFVYTKASNNWKKYTPGFQIGNMEYFTEYSKLHHVIYFGGGNDVPGTRENEGRMFYKLDSEGNVTRLADSPTNLGQKGQGPLQTINPVTGNLMVFKGGVPAGKSYCPCDNPIYEHNSAVNTWANVGTHNLATMYGGDMLTVATPIYEYGVIFFANRTNFNGCKIFLYKPLATSSTKRVKGKTEKSTGHQKD